jgi:hypothetical protein
MSAPSARMGDGMRRVLDGALEHKDRIKDI